jgi:hypothetical protein
MDSPELAEGIIIQGRALVRAVKALDTIESNDPFERAVARLFQAAYERRLKEIVEAAPPWAAEQILSASEHIQDHPASSWTRGN